MYLYAVAEQSARLRVKILVTQAEPVSLGLADLGDLSWAKAKRPKSELQSAERLRLASVRASFS